jgi:hypothetical protein
MGLEPIEKNSGLFYLDAKDRLLYRQDMPGHALCFLTQADTMLLKFHQQFVQHLIGNIQ